MAHSKLKVLFLHFPIDNFQIESRSLPDYFASKGHTVYSVFEKNQRNFYSKHFGVDVPVLSLKKEKIANEEIDLIVCKSASYQSYGKQFKSDETKVINITTMGLERNSAGVDHSFPENWLIKPPIPEMRDIFKENFIPYDRRDNCILIPGSVGQIKNQKEIIGLIDKDIFEEDFYIHFAGPIKSPQYAHELKLMCDEKKIDTRFGKYSKKDLAFHYLNSKLVCLSTDPRPLQPYDPGPRVIFEALSAGTPCVVSDLVLIHEHSHMFSKVYKNKNKESFLAKIKETMDQDLVFLSKFYYNRYEELFSMKNACNVSYEEIITCYQKISS